MQSNVALKPEVAGRLHVGIIMDGNGRWATRRGLSRLRGHEAGVEAIRRIVEAAPDQGVGTLTLYAFSSDNWRRPKAEVTALMGLLRFYLANEIAALVRNGVRLTVIGRRDRLPDGIAAAITRAEAETADGTTMHLRIAIDYSARDAILNAAAHDRARRRLVFPVGLHGAADRKPEPRTVALDHGPAIRDRPVAARSTAVFRFRRQ